MAMFCCEWMPSQTWHGVSGKEWPNLFSYHYPFIHFQTIERSLPPENKQQQQTGRTKATPLRPPQKQQQQQQPLQRQRKERKNKNGKPKFKKTTKNMTPKMETSRLQSWRIKGWEILLLMAVLVMMLTMLHDNFIDPLWKVHGMPCNVSYNKTWNQHILTLPNDTIHSHKQLSVPFTPKHSSILSQSRRPRVPVCSRYVLCLSACLLIVCPNGRWNE